VCVKIFLTLGMMRLYVQLSFTVRVSHMLVLLEKIFGGKFKDIMGKSRKLHKEDHHGMSIP